MIALLWMVLKQVGVAALVLTALQLGLKLLRLEAGAQLIALTFALTLIVLMVAVLSLWTSPAWFYLLLWTFGLILLLLLGLTLWTVLEPNPSQAVRQGVMVLMFPLLAMFAAFPSSAGLKWLLGTLGLMR